MTMQTQIKLTAAETALIDAFGSAIGSLPGDAAVTTQRSTLIQGIKTGGLPTRRREAWHYTDLRRLIANVPVDAPDTALTTDPLVDGSQVLPLVNGLADASAALAGASVKRYRDSLADGSALKGLAIRDADDVIGRLNGSFVRDGYALHFPEGYRAAQPVEIQLVQGGGAVHTRLPVSFGAGASAVVIERHLATGTKPALVSSVTEIALGEGADDQGRSDHREGHLEHEISELRNHDAVREGRGRRVGVDAMQEGLGEAADPGGHAAAVGEGHRVAVQRPDHADHGDDREHLGQDRGHVLGADETAIEQRQPGDGHHQHERAGDEHPGGVTLVGNGGGCGSGGRRVFSERHIDEACDAEPCNCERNPSRAGWTFERHFLLLRKCSGLSAKSESRSVRFAGADAHGVVEADDEDLAVADLAGLGGRRDGVDGLVDLVRGDRDLDLDLGQEAHRIFGAAVDFGMALLTAVPLHFGHRETMNADGGQGVPDFFELEWLNDRHNNFHGSNPRLGPVRTLPSASCRLRFTTRRMLHDAGTAGGIESNAVPDGWSGLTSRES